ncbi:MAG: 4-hydroxy-tetrahydrodipicolinate synthase [Wenzhouxiangella sp.]|jgi:4-hydroxy-tetrahydrodipicolinate synthase|nr:4-hydroxy-tetrahydrodipicolinate synthase [Wenzhouxiangella sp.]
MFSGSIVALITPMTDHGEVDLAAWEALLDWHLAAGTSGVVVAGTTGESVTLTTAEPDALLERAVARCRGRISVLAGTGGPSTATAIERTRRAAEIGADAVLVVTPAYNRPSQRGLEAHFTAIADASPVPVVLYNVPTRTAVDLAPETSLRLARHPRIVAIKEAVADPKRVTELVRGGLTVLSGDDPSCCESMLLGASGVISVAANVVPETIARLCALAAAGDADATRALNEDLKALYRFLSVEANPVPVKWMVHRLGRCRPALRLPLVELEASHHAFGEQVIEGLALDAVSDVA